jgi:hypothetical protein
MPGQHSLRADAGEIPVGIVDITFDVQRDGAQLGNLKVSQGSVEWKQRGKKKAGQLIWGAREKAFLERGRTVKAKGFELQFGH